MLRRLRFRWFLPVLMTGAQIVLSIVCGMQEQRSGRSSAISPPVVQAAVWQEDGGTVSFEPVVSPRPSVTEVATTVLNLPAFIGALILAGWIHQESNAAILWLCVPFVPLVWYAIGRWIDGQIAPVPIVKRRLVGRIAQWAMRTLAIIGLISFLFNSRDGWDVSSSESDFVPLVLWCTSYLFCSFWGERRLRLIWADSSHGRVIEGV